jgi:hypothetical protein
MTASSSTSTQPAMIPRMGSRLERDPYNRLVCVQVTPDHPVVAPGARLLCVGNLIPTTVAGDRGGFGWLGQPTGRPSRVTPARIVEPDVELRCQGCGTRYLVTARTARRGASPLCRLCRGLPEPPAPTAEMFTYWTSRYAPDELAQLAGALR